MRDRRFEALGKLHDLVVGVHTTGARVNRDIRAFRQHVGDPIQSSSLGRMTGLLTWTRNGGSPAASASAMSTGTMSTATPRLEIAA